VCIVGPRLRFGILAWRTASHTAGVPPVKLTDAQVQRITGAVEAAERRTAAEFVVVVRPQSGSYRDIDAYVGVGAAFVMVVFIIFNPWTWHDARLLPVEFAAAFGVGVWFSAWTGVCRRWFTSAARRARQSAEAAMAVFVSEGVGGTTGRTGVLVYLSQLEQRAEVVADAGVLDAVDAQAWAKTLDEMQADARGDDMAEAAANCVERLGALLAACLPVGADDRNELADRPRAHV
jgi:putative membrane protein